MKYTLTIAGLMLAGLLSISSQAEQVRVPIGTQDKAHIDKPRKGLSQAKVEQKYGSPISKKGPIGDPAILFWDYETFTVYFEGDHVIHSVAKFKSNTAVKR